MREAVGLGTVSGAAQPDLRIDAEWRNERGNVLAGVGRVFWMQVLRIQEVGREKWFWESDEKRPKATKNDRKRHGKDGKVTG